MAEQFIIVFGDLVKHIISSYYIDYEDKKLNLLLYAFVSFIVSFILKFLLNYDAFKDQMYHTKWFIKYKLLKTEELIYPCNAVNIKYSPFNDEIYKKDPHKSMHKYELNANSMRLFTDTLGLRLAKNRSNNKSNEYACTYIYNLELRNNSIENKPTTVKVTAATFNLYFVSKSKDLKVIAFVNGYYIFIDISKFTINNFEDLQIISLNRKALDIFMTIVQNDINENKDLLNTKNCGLKIIEYSRKENEHELGNVKPLTFVDYISKYKKMIIQKLDLFKNGTLYTNNCHFENNLGFMLHGTYGTGKTCLITAIANYLERNIYIINFAKIKTKSEYNTIMKPENIMKYVYCLDEFDFLISSLLKADKVDNSAGLQIQIQLLSTQINSCNDPEAKNLLIDKMKKLMETDNNDDLTYEFLLGDLSGLKSVSGRVMIATTNFIDKIPEALLRPGRFDIILHLGYFNNTEIKELLIKLYKPNADELCLIKTTMFPENKYTPAQLIMKATEYTDIHSLINNLISTKIKTN